MSLVFPAAEPDTDAPMLHLLIVGIGEYLYLPQGPMFEKTKARYQLGLRQLTSPPVSAQQLANWMIKRLTSTHRNPKAALGTVELLLSPQAYTDAKGRRIQVEAATFDNVKAAFARFLQRSNRHSDNIAIFYFCGHGMEWEKTYLLCTDYGCDYGTPWANVIDFGISRMGFLADCQAKTLLCVLDACREVKIDMIKSLNIGARPLWDAASPPHGDRDAPIYQATRVGERAHGPPDGGVSYFTQALLDCLDRLGAAASPDGQTWSVSTSSLGLALRQLMWRTLIPNVGPGACDVTGGSTTPEPTVLHNLPGVAHALAEITCDPECALELAELSYCHPGSGNQAVIRIPPCSGAWKIEVAAGAYNVAADFPAGKYLPARENPIFSPPFTRCTLKGIPQ